MFKPSKDRASRDNRAESAHLTIGLAACYRLAMGSNVRIVALTSFLIAVALPAFAQQDTPAATSAAATSPEAAGSNSKGPEEQIVVVGSRTRARSVVDTPVPVDVFDRRAVEQSLTTGELGQALQNLAPSINMPRASASGTSDAIRSIQLRGLAPDEVLVLVNGKRWHTNAVLDQEGLFPGTVPVDLNALPPSAIERIEILRDGAGAQYGSDAVAGVVNIVLKKSPGGEVSAGYGQFHTRFAPTHSTIDDGQNRQVGAAYGLGFGDGGYLRIGADFESRNNTNRAGPASDFSETSSPPDLALVGNVLYRSGDPDVKNLNLFYNGAVGLPFGVEAYSFSTFNTRASEGAAFFRWPGDVENVPAVYPNGFRPVTTGDSIDWGFVAGLRGEASEWAWDLSLRNGYNRFKFGVRNSLNASLGAASPQAFHLNDFRSAQTSLNLDVSRSFRVDPIAGPLVLAFGAEGERDAYRTTPGDPASYAAGTGAGPPGAQAGPGLRPQEAVSTTRNLAAVYADASADLTRHLLLGLSGRFSAHEGFDSALTGKASARYKLTSDLQLRASISNNFRAPALAQTSFRRNSLDFNAAGNGLVNTALLPGNDAVAALFGARQLQPERSVSSGTPAFSSDTLLTFTAMMGPVLNPSITSAGTLFSSAPSTNSSPRSMKGGTIPGTALLAITHCRSNPLSAG